VSKDQLKELQIPVPPLDLQQQFSCFVQRTYSLSDRQNQTTQEINELFHSLMQKAFSGELPGKIHA
jgi:type I restriction enzyme S subunit